MSFGKWITSLFEKVFYDNKWTCNSCGAEIFTDEYFCAQCKSKLPYNNKSICEHCGRQTAVAETYCLTCKNNLPSIDKGRSPFVYSTPISGLIKKLKYKKKGYIADILGDYLAITYWKYFMSADCIVYPPMTKKALRKREYNHAELLANRLSEKIKIPVIDVIEKVKETDRQAKLNRADRMKNLVGAFKIKSRKAIKDKKVIIVDDVTTTGATAEILAAKLKKAGAKYVILLTVASVQSPQ